MPPQTLSHLSVHCSRSTLWVPAVNHHRDTEWPLGSPPVQYWPRTAPHLTAAEQGVSGHQVEVEYIITHHTHTHICECMWAQTFESILCGMPTGHPHTHLKTCTHTSVAQHYHILYTFLPLFSLSEFHALLLDLQGTLDYIMELEEDMAEMYLSHKDTTG